ncbi:sulfur reduction protein DsrE [candidate division WOR_3 bacterium SM23_42]|uniref:Sulfur reduction protein DsrE n=1 Tax=candidate division WOR_3 bacterium SM23_42 TaxID=1703779 RepID=A0A0S8FVU9_UNCW3|nr:MAG: sulfur reduction protein DsrE [candidate division WOR_3 bacterium SM23_42]
MKANNSILYVQTSDSPERQYSPLVLAQTAKAMDIEAKVYYLGQALRVLKPEQAEKIKIGDFPSFADMIKKTLDMGIEIYVCEASKQMLGWNKVELIPGLKIVGAGTLNDLALEASATMWF